MILLYGMPTLIAQGLLFVGFVYILSYAIRFLEHLIRKNKETFQPSDTSQKKERDITPVTSGKKKIIKQLKPRYKVILRIKSDLARLNNNSEYGIIAVKFVQAEGKDIPFQEIHSSNNQIIKEFGDIEEYIDTYWLLDIEDCKFDGHKLKFICVSKYSTCNDLSIYSASEIIYDDRVYKLHRVEDITHLEGYSTALSFDNWINESGMNNRQSSLGTTNKRVL